MISHITMRLEIVLHPIRNPMHILGQFWVYSSILTYSINKTNLISYCKMFWRNNSIWHWLKTTLWLQKRMTSAKLRSFSGIMNYSWWLRMRRIGCSGLIHYTWNSTNPMQNPLDVWMGLGPNLVMRLPVTFRSNCKNAMINIGLVRLFPQ